ncbi:MAG: conserved rane protein of unknown function [Gammaproteobacteria bacterium]|jgi:uncharacterized membrane protein YccC|nr:conserved rane protein of unknown function [Gammaproteobacteria bacterium]
MIKDISDFLAEQIQSLQAEYKDFCFSSNQSHIAFKSALAVCLALLISLMLNIPNPFWAGISALVVTQAHVGASFQRALYRSIATIAVAILGVFFVSLFANSFVLWIVLFISVILLIYQSVISPYPYGWIIAAATLLMIDIMAFISPYQVIDTAYYRSLEVIIGSTTAWISNWLFSPKYAKHELEEHMIHTINCFQEIYQLALTQAPLAYTEFFYTYKKFVQQLEQTRQLLKLTMLESLFGRQKYKLFKRLLLAAQESGEMLLDYKLYAENTSTQWETAFPQPLFFQAIINYIENPTTEKEVLQALDAWKYSLSIGLSQPCALLNNLPTIFKEIFNPAYEEASSFRNRFRYINKIALLQGIRAAVCATVVPLIWIYLKMPGLSQISVSVIAILQLNPLATKAKGYARLLGCLLGSLTVYLILGLNINNIVLFLLVIFGVVFCFAYLHHGKKVSTLGTQAGVVFILGMLTDLSPAVAFDQVFDRLIGIFLGVLTTVIITQYLWPFKAHQFLRYKLEEAKDNINFVIQQAFRETTPFSFLSLFMPLRKTVKEFEHLEIKDSQNSAIDTQLCEAIKTIYHNLFALACINKFIIDNKSKLPTTIIEKNQTIFASLQTLFALDNKHLDQAKRIIDECQIHYQEIISLAKDPAYTNYLAELAFFLKQLLEDIIKWLMALEAFICIDAKKYLAKDLEH